MNQAHEAGLSEDELIELKDAFQLAQAMSHGFYRASGVPLLNHLVSTASIVLSEKNQAGTVIPALLHAVYVLHRFDDSSASRNLEKRRTELRERLGSQMESLLWQYQQMGWYRVDTVRNYLENLPELDDTTRSLLLLRLANELDDHLYQAMDYAELRTQERKTQEFLELCGKLAEGLAFTTIAEELNRLSRQQPGQHAAGMTPGTNLRWNRGECYEFHAEVWRKSWLERLGHRLDRTRYRVKSRISRLLKYN